VPLTTGILWLDNHAPNLINADAAGGKVSAFTSGDQPIQLLSASADHAKMVTSISTPLMIGDLVSIASYEKQIQLTPISAEGPATSRAPTKYSSFSTSTAARTAPMPWIARVQSC
jgi:hypothetical protein